MPKPGIGRRVIDFTKNQATDLVATGLTAGLVVGVGYWGGKAALTTAGIVGGGLFATIVVHETIKLSIEKLTITVKDSFKPAQPEGLRRQPDTSGVQQPSAAAL